MSVLVTADLHLTENPRDAYRHLFQKRLRDLAEMCKPCCVIILGDLCEMKDKHSAYLLNAVVDHLLALSEICPVVILMGNHDYVDETSPYWAFLNHFPRIYWIDKPTEATVNVPPVLGLQALGRVLFLPHTHDYKRAWKGFKLKQYDYIFAHQTFDGAFDRVKLSGIPTKIFGSSKVISGDIHVPQILNKGTVEYVGAPYTVDFGDRYQPRVLLIEDDGRIQSVLTKGPQKRLITLNNKGGIIESDANPGDIVKIRVEITASDFAEWPEIKARAREWAEDAGFVVYVVESVVERDAVKRGEPREIETKPDEQVVKDYAQQQGRDKLTTKAALNIMRRT